MTIRQRLTGMIVLATLLGVLLASIAGAVYARNQQVRMAERSVRVLTTVVAARLARGPEVPLERLPLEAFADRTGVRLLVVGPDGTVERDSQQALEGETLPARTLLTPQTPAAVQRARVGGTPYFFSVVPGSEERAQRLVVAVPSETLLDSWLSLLPWVLLFSAAGVALAGLVAWEMARRLSAPLEALTGAATKLADGDYDARVEPPQEPAELATLARTFNSMADEVRSARQTQRDFLANVSHDLRTPLTSIQGFSQALMDGAVPEEQTPRVAGIIHTEAARLSRLVQDLLDLARIEAGRFTMSQRDVSLNTVLERCKEKFEPQAASMGVKFDAKIPRRALPVHGDADRLEQVVTNLVDNALTYAQYGGGHVRLSGALGGIRGSHALRGSNGHSAHANEAEAPHGAESAPDGTSAELIEEHSSDPMARLGRWWIEIRIEDDGPGIPDDQKPLVFERFYRADSARGGGGTMGLGLAIAREIVQAHGGDIVIEDAAQSERGTQFVVRLPMKMK